MMYPWFIKFLFFFLFFSFFVDGSTLILLEWRLRNFSWKPEWTGVSLPDARIVMWAISLCLRGAHGLVWIHGLFLLIFFRLDRLMAGLRRTNHFWKAFCRSHNPMLISFSNVFCTCAGEMARLRTSRYRAPEITTTFTAGRSSLRCMNLSNTTWKTKGT